MSDKRISHMMDKVGIDYPDRRSEKRGPGMLSACLICGDDGQVANCLLLDVSAMGAKVKFDKRSGYGEHVNLSSALRLTIAAFVDFPVEVIWQDDRTVGLRFLSDPQQVAAVLKEFLPECVSFDDVETDAA